MRLSLLLFLLCAPLLAISQETPALSKDLDREALRAAAKNYLAGDEKAAVILRLAGPAVLAHVRDLFVGEEARASLRKLSLEVVREVLKRSLKEEPDLRYHGQFQSLVVTGDEGGDALLDIFCDEDASIPLRNRAAGALGDVGSERHLSRLRAVVKDFLTEAWMEREAGYVMARLGDRSYVERLVEKNRIITAQTPNTANVPALIGAHTELAEIYYRIGEYGAAVMNYRKKLVLLEDLQERVQDGMRVAVRDEIHLLHYNLACSLSLTGKTEEAFEALRTALAHAEITLEMVGTDGDLRHLRAHSSYEDWLAKMKKLHPPRPPKGA